MKKLLSLMAVLALLLSCCLMGIGTVATAAEESPEADFIVFDGVLEEYIGPGGDVVVPASLGVVEIAADAMRVNNDITSFVLPEGVEVIGLRAFWHCENLTSITLPYSCYEIGQEAFSTCALTEIMIPPQVEMVPYGMCSGCYYLSEIVFSYGVKEVHGGAFGGTIATKVVFPETIEFIGGYAFNFVRSSGPVEWIICNPDCEIGFYALGDALEKDWANHNLSDVPRRPINNTLHPGMQVKFVVPEDSAIAEFINAQKDVMLDRNDQFNDKKYCDGTTYRVTTKAASYFAELEENQKGFGVQKPADSNNNNTQNPGVEKDETPGSENDINDTETVDKGNGSNTTQNKNENNNDNGGSKKGSSNKEDEPDNSTMWIILAVVGGVVLLIIIGVVVFLVVYLNKPKAPAAPYGYPPYGYPPVGPDGQPVAPAAEPAEAVAEEAPAPETPAE